MKQGTALGIPQQREGFLLQLWPLTEEVNKTCPDDARISIELIMMFSSAKRIIRSVKGIVQRSAIVAFQDEELDVKFCRNYGRGLNIILAGYLELSMMHCYYFLISISGESLATAVETFLVVRI